MRLLGQWDEFLAPTPNQREVLSWILDQNWQSDQETEATGIVERLQAKAETKKEQARHMQCQSPKSKKKPKKAVVNGGNQKIKYKRNKGKKRVVEG